MLGVTVGGTGVGGGVSVFGERTGVKVGVTPGGMDVHKAVGWGVGRALMASVPQETRKQKAKTTTRNLSFMISFTTEASGY